MVSECGCVREGERETGRDRYREDSVCVRPRMCVRD